MTYTPDQLRKWADDVERMGHLPTAQIYRAYAAALEEIDLLKDGESLMMRNAQKWKERAEQAERRAELLKACIEKAIKDGYEMIDPLRPPPAGSYNMGHHNGVVDALRQVRANYERLLLVEFKPEEPKP